MHMATSDARLPSTHRNSSMVSNFKETSEHAALVPASQSRGKAARVLAFRISGRTVAWEERDRDRDGARQDDIAVRCLGEEAHPRRSPAHGRQPGSG